MLARINLNSIANIISKTLIESKISHEDFTTIINEERNYREVKQSIIMMKSQRSDIERNRLIKDGKIIGIDEVISQNERINKSKSQV